MNLHFTTNNTGNEGKWLSQIKPLKIYVVITEECDDTEIDLLNRVFHDKHGIYQHVNVVEVFVIQWEIRMDENNSTKYSIIYMMNCAAKSITCSDQI